MEVERTFLGWDRPLAQQAVEHLAVGWSGKAALDLSYLLIVVSSSNAGRMLREGLARITNAQDTGVLTPHIVTPGQMLKFGQAPLPSASKLQSWLAWRDVLIDVDLDELRAVFPVDPPKQDDAWALGLAERLDSLKQTLAENAHSIASASKNFQATADAERWEQLSRLETTYRNRIQQAGYTDRNDSCKYTLQEPQLPKGIKKVLLIGVSDAPPVMFSLITQITLPIQILVHAPEEEAIHFDAWGRPIPEHWATRPINTPLPTVCNQPVEQAEEALQCVHKNPSPLETATLGMADEQLSPYIKLKLDSAGIQTYDPNGTPHSQSSLYVFLGSLLRLLQDRSAGAFHELLQHPAFCNCYGTTQATALEAFQYFSDIHLPRTLDDFAFFSKRTIEEREGENEQQSKHRLKHNQHCETLAPLCAKLIGWLKALQSAFDVSAFCTQLSKFFPEPDTLSSDMADTMLEVLSESESWVHEKRIKTADRLQLLLNTLKEGRSYDAVENNEIPLKGWLELMWDDAPHLILSGLNDGCVPDSLHSDTFLPGSMRAQLGLTTNQQRYARDAYILTALIASRTHIDIIIGLYSTNNDPQKPSRLLYHVPDNELPERVKALHQAPATKPKLIDGKAWEWTPRAYPHPEYISVTRFSDYLDCPFRYYLKHILKMEAIAPYRQELDAREFGNLCHEALEDMALDSDLVNCTDENKLRAFLKDRAEKRATFTYGKNWSVPVQLQVESAIERLGGVAHWRAEANAEGWRIKHAEYSFHKQEASSFQIEGFEIRGTADVIEQNESTGQWRIIDYKTFDSITTPEKKHISTLRENTPEYAQILMGKRLKRWANLQLPLYYWALKEKLGEDLSLGYLILPKAVSETQYIQWDLNKNTLESAYNCAAGIVKDIQAGKFGPPSDKPEYDDFKQLFDGPIEEQIQAGWETVSAQ